jgi:predicted outer membrane repeat protein
MSNDPPERRGISELEAAQPLSPRTWGRARWYAAGLAGLAAFSAVAGVTGSTGTDGLDNESNSLSSATQVLAADRVDGTPNGSGAKDAGSGQQGSRGNEQLVPCDADALIAAIVRANASGGASLRLTARCTYTLTAAQGPDGLPVISQPISLDGQGATIARAANAANFRILNVGVGGNLTLENLTVAGGFAPDPDGGGGILVQSGGQATLRNATVAGNRSTSFGGGIANYGITTLLGRNDGSGTGSWGNSGAPDKASGGGPAQASPGGRSGGSARKADAGQTISKVDNNSTVNSGGGIYNEGHLSADNVEVSYNHSGRGGGGLTDLGNAVLKRARIDHNAAAAGDVVGVAGGGIASGSAITKLEDSSVSDNTAGGDGGGIACEASTIYLRGTRVDHNTATGDGGGIDNEISPLIGGGVCSAVIEDSEVSGNTASGSGGGLNNRVSNLVLRRSHVSLNRAIGAASQAGGISNGNGAITLTATQVTGNSSTVAPGGVSSNRDLVTVDQNSVIVANRPTNCAGSAVAVPNCFG